MAPFPFFSLRDWIEFLQEGGQLVKNEEEVDLRGEVATISRMIARFGSEAVLHQRVKGYPGWQVFSDGLTTRQRQAWALGIQPKGMTQRVAQLLSSQPVKPKIVPTGPCKQVKLFGEDINLASIPVPYTGEWDIPPIITAGIAHTKDPQTGWQNLGIRRYQLKGKKKLSVIILPFMHEGMIFSKFLERHQPMPTAIVIGADPLYYLCSLMPAPPQVDEMDYWGQIAGKPFEAVKCETSDILVPATAEIVIEGVVDPEKRELEGPFSEMPGYYSGMRLCPVVEVKAVTMREDAIYQYMYTGVPPTEAHAIVEPMNELEIYRQVKKIVPELSDVAILSTWGLTTALSLDKQARMKKPGLVKRAAMAVKAVQPGAYIKNLFIFDNDIDIHNPAEVWWAMSVKFQASKDINVITDTVGIGIDPSEPWAGLGFGHTDFAIFDCTEKPPPYDEGYKRGLALPSKEIFKKVEEKWKKYGFKTG